MTADTQAISAVVDSRERFDFVRKLSSFPERIAAVLERNLASAISTVYLDVNTDICNHACHFCDGYYRSLEAAEFPWPRLTQLVEEMRELGVQALVIAGDRGEPFLYSRITEFFEQLGKTDIHFGIYTNGTFIPTVCLEPLRRASFVRISVDAGTSATHRAMHGYAPHRNDFEQVLRNVGVLASRIEDVGVSFVIDPINAEEIELAANVFLSGGAHFIEFKPKYIPGYGVEASWYRAEGPRLRERLTRAIERWGTERVVLNGQIPRLLDGQGSGDLVVIGRYCRASLLRLVISTHGCYTCTPYRGEAERRVGDILQQSLREVVESAERRKLDHRTCSRCCAYHEQNEFLLQLEGEGRAIPDAAPITAEQQFFV